MAKQGLCQISPRQDGALEGVQALEAALKCREQNVEGEQLRKGGWKGKINNPVQQSPKRLQFAGASKLLVNIYGYHGHWRTDFSPESSNLLKSDLLQKKKKKSVK